MRVLIGSPEDKVYGVKGGQFVEPPGRDFDEEVMGYRIAVNPKGESWCSVRECNGTVVIYLFIRNEETEIWTLSAEILRAIHYAASGYQSCGVDNWEVRQTSEGFVFKDISKARKETWTELGPYFLIDGPEACMRTPPQFEGPIANKLLMHVPLGWHLNTKKFVMVSDMYNGGPQCPKCGYVNNGYMFKGVCERCRYKEQGVDYL